MLSPVILRPNDCSEQTTQSYSILFYSPPVIEASPFINSLSRRWSQVSPSQELPQSFSPAAMRGEGLLRPDVLIKFEPSNPYFVPGGLFLDDSIPCSSSFAAVVCRKRRAGPRLAVGVGWCKNASLGPIWAREGFRNGWFLSVSLSIRANEQGCFRQPAKVSGNNGKSVKLEVALVGEKKVRGARKSGALNATKHLWAGAVAAMVSRFCAHPLL